MSVQVHIHDADGYRVQEGLAGLAEYLAKADTQVWIDTSVRTDELEATLRETFKLHPLMLEDIFCDAQVPKVEDYGEHLYVVLHGVSRDADKPELLHTAEIDIVLGRNWLFTHHAHGSRSIEEVVRELERTPRALTRGPAYLAHAIIDKLTDRYLPVLEHFQEDIDTIEKTVVEGPSGDMLGHIFSMKRSLQRLRRVAVYQRDILQRLSRGEFEIIPQPALVFYRDVYDHYVRISELADTYRELMTAALEVYLSVSANRTNDIMKVLAVISTVMLPLTFVAGVYGMNFKYMPELQWRYGYPFALGLMATITISLLYWFRRRGWL